MSSVVSFDAWLASIAPVQRADPLWRVTAYRLAMYAVYLAWHDARILDRVRITRPIAGQLYRAVGSIAANIAEGYSRSSGPDRVRVFEYGLGSARESAVWHEAARPVLGEAVYESRLELLSRIRRLLLSTIPDERNRRITRHSPR